MDENAKDIVEEYFRARKHCTTLDCAKVIFEPSEKKNGSLMKASGAILSFAVKTEITDSFVHWKKTLMTAVC